MILFSDANGTIQANFGTPVYQGSANSNIIYLIAPYAPAASVLVGFQLPDGTAVAPVAMTPLNAVPGVQNAGGTSYAGWSYVLPAAVTAKYGTVTAQFFFYAPTGESTNPTSIIATSATSFQIGRGAAAVLPDTPDADVYESILSNLAQLQTDLNGGYYGARAIFPWSNGATYGLNEITFYPSIGTYGAFVQSVVAGNTNNVPYVDGVLNSAYWKEVVNFNTVTEEYFQQVQEAVSQAESAATEAESSAQAAANSATMSTNSATVAIERAAAASGFANNAEAYAQQSAQSAQAAAASATQSQNSAEQSGNYAGNAQTSAQNAADSATAAQQYAEQAQQYAQKHYQVVASVAELPRPGDSAFIYLVPTGSGTSNDSYSEYLWITESNDYEFIGTTADIDLSNYAQINGTYAGMTVGNATNAQTATNAQQLGGVAAANYAQTNGTYSGMTVGNATQAQNAATATDSEKLGGVLANQYAIITGTYSGMTVGNATNATNADTADSATSAQDSAKLGGVAASQYAQIAQIPSNVIAVESLPTATADSPDFVQITDGTLYRKQTIQNNSLIGTWQFGSGMAASIPENWTFDFTCDGVNYTGILVQADLESIKYQGSNPVTVYQFGWLNNKYKTITITDISGITDQAAFTEYMTSKATKLPTYSYEQVGGTEVVANPTATGTQDLTSLQVGGTVYNIPQGSGGITNAEVIEYADELPTASETSPNFIQTPDGTLYRKKAVEGGSLLGTWVFNDTISIMTGNVYAINFTSNGESYSRLTFEVSREDIYVKYGSTTVASGNIASTNWINDNFKTIDITDTSGLTDPDEFESFMNTVAKQQGGGVSISYEYVAMQEVLTPTTADNGKVLGVTNGAYALQEASGGGGSTGYTVEFYEIYEGTVIYADGSTEPISGNGTKNNVRMIVGLTGNQNSWGIQKAVCLYNGQVKYGLSATGDAQTVDIVIPVNNECFIESWPD